MAEAPIEVAIVGGGCAAMAAAFELSRPHLRDRYRITVYQLGWRLGGKGASGRGVGDRIEEHGLHLWMGFYENAFRLMRECYEEANRDPMTCPLATWRDAFVPDHYAGIAEQTNSGAWRPWLTHLPANDGLPGDPLPNYRSPSILDYMMQGIIMVRSLLEGIGSDNRPQPGRPPASHEGAKGQPEALLANMTRLLSYGRLATLAAVFEAMEMFELALESFPAIPTKLLLGFHDLIKLGIRRQIETMAREEDECRRLWEVIDLTFAAIRGIIRHRLLFDPRGFDAINEYDCMEWLQMHGASEESVRSAFARGLYDLAFSYEDGDVERPRVAAGQGLRGALRAYFTYRGAFFWKMQAGMGDVVFAPFYEVLRRRGVRFEFFHRLRNMVLSDTSTLSLGERPHIRALELDVQAEVVDGAPYEPLIDVHGLPCWPAQPDWDQLVDGPQMRSEGWDFESHWDERRSSRKTLEVGRDFDLVVLGVGVGAVPYVAKELIAFDPKWQAMVKNCKSVATQAFQVWMSTDMHGLGWHQEQVNISGFVEPFDTWADMRQLIQRESFPEPPRSIAYFCSVLPDPPHAAKREGAEFRQAQYDQVKANAINFLNRDIVHLWPNACIAPGRFRWELLVDAQGGGGTKPNDASRFDSQFWVANVDPTARYALALPGTLVHRISPLDMSFDNLTICGDYTDAGFSQGCVETAVMSGMLAAHAVCGSPALSEIVGYDHP